MDNNINREEEKGGIGGNNDNGRDYNGNGQGGGYLNINARITKSPNGSHLPPDVFEALVGMSASNLDSSTVHVECHL